MGSGPGTAVSRIILIIKLSSLLYDRGYKYPNDTGKRTHPFIEGRPAWEVLFFYLILGGGRASNA